MLGNLIGGFIVLLVGWTLFPTIKSQIIDAINQNQTLISSLTPATRTIMDIIPYFFIVMCVLIALTMWVQGLRNAGIFGNKYREDYDEYLDGWTLEKEKEDNHKQTYYEYVQERIAIERKMRGRIFG